MYYTLYNVADVQLWYEKTHRADESAEKNADGPTALVQQLVLYIGVYGLGHRIWQHRACDRTRNLLHFACQIITVFVFRFALCFLQWRFPKLCYEYGGGAFLIPYLLVLFFFTIPLVVLEMALGQRYQVSHVRMLALAARGSPSSSSSGGSGGIISDVSTASFAGGLGWSAVVGTFLLSQFYCALLSITFSYLVASFSASLPWTDGRAHDYFLNVTWPSDGVDDMGGLVPPLLGGYVLVYLLVAAGAANSSASIEVLNKVLMPVPFLVLVVFLIRGLTLDGAAAGVAALFTPDPAKLRSAEIWLAAVSQLFFGVSAGLGTLTTYASFMPHDTPIVGSAILVCLGNSAFSLLAGITVFAFLGNLAHTRNVPVTSVGACARCRLQERHFTTPAWHFSMC